MAKEDPASRSAAGSAAPVRVEIYTERFGAASIRAKGLLDRKGVSYSEFAVDDDDINRGEMLKRAGGRQHPPQIFVNNRLIGGWEELSRLDQRGALDQLLGLVDQDPGA